jgi:hypothetical protein
MMNRISTDGRTFEAFCTDPELWTDGSYLDHFVIMVNGVRLEDHTGEIRASDQITIFGGVVQRPGRPADPLGDVFVAWAGTDGEPHTLVA